MKSLPSVSLYIRSTNEKGRRRYERIRRRNPQMCGPKDVYCLHFYENDKRKWLSVGTDLSVANGARGQKEQELLLLSKEDYAQPKPTPAAPKSLEALRTAFIHDKRTTIKKDGTPLHPNTIRSFEVVTRGFLDTIKRSFPSEVTKQDLKDWMMKLRQGDPARKRRAVSHRYDEYPTSPTRSVDSTLEENHATKQERRITEAQTRYPKERQGREGTEAASSGEEHERGWEKPRGRHSPVQPCWTAHARRVPAGLWRAWTPYDVDCPSSCGRSREQVSGRIRR